MKLSCLAVLSLLGSALSYEYTLDGVSDISFTDQETTIGGLLTLFTNKQTDVSVSLSWLEEANEMGDVLSYKTLSGSTVLAEGTIDLVDGPPESLDVGPIEVDDRGTHVITVEITVGEETVSTSKQLQAYGPVVSIIPLIVVLGFSVVSRMVELSLFSAIFVGACMVEGDVMNGFKRSLGVYILEALADIDHGYVYLFTLFLSGLVGMMQKSGGMDGFTRDVSKVAKTARTGQCAAFFVGCAVFFDDYANVLLAGQSMRPLLDSLFVSREKLAFLVDATAAPIASISPISSWVGFEVGLIQDEIDAIIAREGTEDIGIQISGYGVFLQTIRYRYYPIFMLILIMCLVVTQRDFGSMLIAERKTQVYKRTDGGDGHGEAGELENSPYIMPRPGTPMQTFNFVVPLFLLIFFIFYTLVKTGEIEGEDQDFLDKIEASNSYDALLWGTMAAAICSLLFYMLQVVQYGKNVVPTGEVMKTFVFSNTPEDDPENARARSLMNIKENFDAFLHGMGRIFPALVVLTLAWAVGSMVRDVGTDRLFARWITQGVAAENLPTLSFLISFFMALATGTSWGTMTILFPLVLIPTYDVSGGDPEIFYATTAGILSGSVAGDHCSPISDTTVLSSLACDCKLLAHVGTQMGYVLVVVAVSILFGTVPIGRETWPNIVGFAIGSVVLIAFVLFVCVPVISVTGRFDPITELYISYLESRGVDNTELQILKDDTVMAYVGETPGLDTPVEKKLDEEEEDDVSKEDEVVKESPVEA